MKITTFLTSLIFLCAGMCCPPEDDTPYVSYDFNTPGLITVEGDSNKFIQNDTLWVNIDVPRKLLNVNKEEFDIFELTGNTGEATANFNLYLANNFENPSPVILSENEIISDVGAIEYRYNLNATAVETDGILKSRFGIILKEKGSYFFSSGYLPNPPSIYLKSDTYNSVYILTGFSEENESRYEFLVE